MHSLKEWEEAQAALHRALAAKDTWEEFRERIRTVPAWFWGEQRPEEISEAECVGLARETMGVFIQRLIKIGEQGDEKTRQYLGLISSLLCRPTGKS